MIPNEYRATIDLLRAIWKGMDSDFKARYKQDIWRIFEDRVRLAAGQNGTLERFISDLARKCGASIGTNEETRQYAVNAMQANAIPMLRQLREETPLIILYMRLELQEERKVYEDQC